VGDGDVLRKLTDELTDEMTALVRDLRSSYPLRWS
jgi:hypothetical protein